MSFQRLLDDICALDNQRAASYHDFDEDAAFKAFEPPRPNFAKSMGALNRRLSRQGKRLKKATGAGSVWDKLTPTGDDQPHKPPDYDAFLDRCAEAMKRGEITGEELIILEGVVNRMKAGMVA